MLFQSSFLTLLYFPIKLFRMGQLDTNSSQGRLIYGNVGGASPFLTPLSEILIFHRIFVFFFVFQLTKYLNNVNIEIY